MLEGTGIGGKSNKVLQKLGQFLNLIQGVDDFRIKCGGLGRRPGVQGVTAVGDVLPEVREGVFVCLRQRLFAWLSDGQDQDEPLQNRI